MLSSHIENIEMKNRMQNIIIKKALLNPDPPEWAIDAFKAYKDAGYNHDERGHSMDFYRIITLLYHKNLL